MILGLGVWLCDCTCHWCPTFLCTSDPNLVVLYKWPLKRGLFFSDLQLGHQKFMDGRSWFMVCVSYVAFESVIFVQVNLPTCYLEVPSLIPESSCGSRSKRCNRRNMAMPLLLVLPNGPKAISRDGQFMPGDFSLHPRRLTWSIIMEVWKMIFLSKWVICRFHVNLPGCRRCVCFFCFR